MKLLNPLFFLMIAACAKAPGPITPSTPVERQMIGLLQKFDRWDESGDGYLTTGELRKAEQITGHPPEKIVAFYDKSGDGRISLAEAQDGLSRFDEAERAVKR